MTSMLPKVNWTIVLSFVAGALAATIGIIIWMNATPSARAQEGEPVQEDGSSLNSIYFRELDEELNKAGDKIQDPATKSFYTKLIEGYNLDEASSDVGDDWLPDMDAIQKRALLLPFQEAGTNIKDKDIADFYARFLAETGLGPQQ
jgi:hypothetical protein